MTTQTANTNPESISPIAVVARIGMGKKTHLAFDKKSTRLFTVCGSDSPTSRAWKSGDDLSQISCTKCRNYAITHGLLSDLISGLDLSNNV